MTKRYLKTPEEVIDALQDGKVLTDGASRWMFYKGYIVRKDEDGYWLVSDSVGSDYDIYIDEPEPFKLEVGKFYKTRDGRKSWITSVRNDKLNYYPFCCMVLGGNEVYHVDKQGFALCTETSELDLVAPWEE